MDINPTLESRKISDYSPRCLNEKVAKPTYKKQPLPYDHGYGCVENSSDGGPKAYNSECRPSPKGIHTDSGRN